MASKTAILAIKIISDASRAPQGFNKTSTAAQRMQRTVGKAASVSKLALLGLGAASLSAARNAGRDQRAQALLAKAMRNAAGATKGQIAAIEQYISKTSLAAGVSDDELRPALAALVRSTGDVGVAQKELNRALDVSAATGKGVEQVANAIAKAHSGQTSALSRLVPGIDQAAIKSKDMNKIMAELSRTTGGSAATAAATAEGKVRRMSIAFDEAQESLGAALIPVLLKVSTVLMHVGVFIGNNTKLVTIIVAVFATLAAIVITVNAAYSVYRAGLLIVTALQRASTIVTVAQTAAQYAMGTAWLAGRVAALAFAVGMRILNAAFAANPVGLIIVAIGIVIGLFVLAYKRSSTFRSIVQATGRAGQVALGWIVEKAKSVGVWLAKLGPAASKAKTIAVTAFKAYTFPLRKLIELIQKVVEWISKIKFPKVPGAIKKIGGLFGGGDDPRPPDMGGGSAPAGGAGGPGSGPGFSFGVGGRRGAGYVQIIVQGAVDPEGTARQIRRILFDSNTRNGGWVPTP